LAPSRTTVEQIIGDVQASEAIYANIDFVFTYRTKQVKADHGMPPDRVPDGDGGTYAYCRHSPEYFRFFQPTDRVGALLVFEISLDGANWVGHHLGMALFEPIGTKPLVR
jgi:hypothetical protein